MAASYPNSVGAYDAKTRFSELLENVAAGAEITITKHGSPVARLVPYRRTPTPADRQAAIAAWIESARGLSLGGLKVRDLIDEGRR